MTRAATEAMLDESLVVKWSAGQLREHPLVPDARHQRALFSRLTPALSLRRTGRAPCVWRRPARYLGTAIYGFSQMKRAG